MAPSSRNNPTLKRRISRLRLNLTSEYKQINPPMANQMDLPRMIGVLRKKLFPIYPQPAGRPHPKFPKTIMHWFLLTEDELDSIAEYYSQITPNEFTDMYPAPMHWDKEFLAQPEVKSPQLMPWDEPFLAYFGWVPRHSSTATTTASNERIDTPLPHPPRANNHQRQHHFPHQEPSSDQSPSLPFTRLSTVERLAIKRRKLGKFMGLRGCETPVSEAQRRIWFLEARLRKNMATQVDSRGGRNEGWGSPRGPPRFGKGML